MNTPKTASHFDAGVAATLVGVPIGTMLLFTHLPLLLPPLVAVATVALAATRVPPDASRRRIAVAVGLWCFVIMGAPLTVLVFR